MQLESGRTGKVSPCTIQYLTVYVNEGGTWRIPDPGGSVLVSSCITVWNMSVAERRTPSGGEPGGRQRGPGLSGSLDGPAASR
jgi:hypothetical protein